MTSYHHAGPVGIGIIGAGTISVEYLTNLTSFPDVVVHIVGDLFPEAAQKRAEEFGVPASGTTQDVLDHRSEEHTSELQSRGHLVCRLLLEKKNKKGGTYNS